MKIELFPMRRLGRLALAFGLSLAAASAHAQPASDADSRPAGTSWGSEPRASGDQAEQGEGETRRERRPRRSRGEIRPYLEVTQVLSADLNGGETLTYTNLAIGVDGRVETRRVTAQMSYRYDRSIEWNGDVADRDIHSGIAMVNAQVVPGLLQLDAGALATRTGGEGRALGLTRGDRAVNVYSFYAGPTLSTRAGPLAVNASYRFGYVKIDDDRIGGPLDADFDSSTAHSLTGSVGMGPGRLPVGWTLGGGYARENNGGRYDQRFEGAYVRGDILVPVSATLAFTAGVGYEDIQSSQRDVVRDAGGVPVPGPDGRPTPDPAAPRLLTYDMDGIMYDAGLIWRPTARTELQARAGRRYGGTTVVGSFTHQFNADYGVSAQVYDSVQTFGQSLNNDLSNLPANFDINRDPLTGGFGCAFGAAGGSGICLDRTLVSITGNTYRARGGNILFSGSRNLWSFGAGAGYAHRRYHRPDGPGFEAVAASEDEVFSLYGTVGRRLSRTSDVNFDVYASWFDSDLAGVGDVRTMGATLSYNRSFLLERLRLLAAIGLYNTDDGLDSRTNASALVGLRYTF